MTELKNLPPMPERSDGNFMAAPGIAPAYAVQVWKSWEELVLKLLDGPNDYYLLKIRSGPQAGQEVRALALAGARTLKRAFQLNVEFDAKRDLEEVRQPNGDVVWARATVKVTDPYGNTGIGISSINWPTLHQQNPGANASRDLTPRVVSNAFRNAVVQWSGIDFRSAEDEDAEPLVAEVVSRPAPPPPAVANGAGRPSAALVLLESELHSYPSIRYQELREALEAKVGKPLAEFTDEEAEAYTQSIRTRKERDHAKG